MNNKAQTLVEISIGVGIFVMIAAAIITMTIGSYQANFKAAQETEAGHLAREGLEATRAIKNYNWGNLADGPHGLTDTNGYWEFHGASQTIGPYAREIIIEPVTRQGDLCGTPGGPDVVDPDAKKVTSKITWETIPAKTRTLELVSYLSNWMGPGQSKCVECVKYEMPSMIIEEDATLDLTGKDAVLGGYNHIDADSEDDPLALTIITNCSLTVEAQAKITANGSYENGDGGTINIQAPDVNIDGTVSANGYSPWKPEKLSAKGGQINIDATNLILKGEIWARGYTYSSSQNSPGGTVTIKTTETTTLEHHGEISVSAFYVKSASEKSDAGTINIESQEFANSGKIWANTFGSHGRAGIINIKAANTSSNNNTEITANSWGTTGEAYGGTISLSANQLNILTSSISAIDIYKKKKPGTISLICCQKDFTGTTFNPTPGEIITCP